VKLERVSVYAGKLFRMSKNLVVCLDGTDNEFCAHNTNVVRLYQSLATDPARQLSYYDPGVGTIWEPGTISRIEQRTQMILGLAFGLGVTRNVSEAYQFLMRAYEPGDRIFLFGFSRGALEARAVAALIHRCGLLQAHLEQLIPYAVRLFQTAGERDVVGAFKTTFSRTVDVQFLGLWDTVTSMGNVWSPVHWPNTAYNPAVRHVGHAVALDERRAFFRPNRWGGRFPVERQTVSEVWFAGVHSDVGGGYPAASSRLWAITLEWMARHARDAGLVFDDARLSAALSEGRPGQSDLPDYATAQHDSLTALWKPLEAVPRRARERTGTGTFTDPRWMIPLAQAGFKGRPRTLTPGEQVHRTAVQRFVALPGYRPPTLVDAGLTDDVARRFLESGDESWTVPARGAAAPPA